MKKSEILRNTKVGIFTIVGLAIISFFIFYIGSRKQLIGEIVTIKANFKNVAGLKHGNAVRFAGVTIGTVEKIQIISDSTVVVIMNINKDDSKFVKKDSRAEIKTEGMLGSKYICISAGTISPVENEDRLAADESVEMDQLISLVHETGKSVQKITRNIERSTESINNKEGILGVLISDASLRNKLYSTITHINKSGENINKASGKMIDIMDTIEVTGENISASSKNFRIFSEKINDNANTIGKLAGDSATANQVKRTLDKAETAADEVRIASERISNSWFVRVFAKNKKKQ